MLNSKTLKRLVFITIICTIPVVWIAINNSDIATDSKHKKLFPTLIKQREQIAKVIVQSHNRTLTLQKKDGAWSVLENNNYPVMTAKVDDLLFSLADLRVIEPKTARPEFHEQLDVNDVSEPQSNALLVTLQNAKGADVAKIYVGKRESIRLGEEFQEHIFIRRAGEDQTWLVQGVLPLSTDFKEWVEQPLLGIVDSDQVQRLTIDVPSVSNIVISKENPEQEDFIIETAQIKSVKGQTLDLDTVNTLPFDVAELEFDNVVGPDSANLDWANSVVATLDTFAGVRLALNVIKHDGKVYAKVHASAAADAPEAMQNTVKTYNASRQQWIYEVPKQFYNTITVSNNDFVIQGDAPAVN
jgi:hypothetical protein